MKKEAKKIQGTISISAKGTGYVKILNEVPTKVGIPTEVGKDPEIDYKYLNTALHGDKVEIILHSKANRRLTGEVTKIISRVKIGFSGVLEEAFPSPSGERKTSFKTFFLKPDDTKMYTDIFIPEKMLNGAKSGQKVYVEISSWKDARKAPEGKVIKILGKPGENNAENMR